MALVLVAESELMLVSEQNPFTFRKHDLEYYFKRHHLSQEAQNIKLRSNLLLCLSKYLIMLIPPTEQRRGAQRR